MVYHLHNPSAVMVSLLYPGTEFRMTHQKLIQGIQKGNSGIVYTNFRYSIFVVRSIYKSILHLKMCLITSINIRS